MRWQSDSSLLKHKESEREGEMLSSVSVGVCFNNVYFYLHLINKNVATSADNMPTSSDSWNIGLGHICVRVCVSVCVCGCVFGP